MPFQRLSFDKFDYTCWIISMMGDFWEISKNPSVTGSHAALTCENSKKDAQIGRGQIPLLAFQQRLAWLIIKL